MRKNLFNWWQGANAFLPGNEVQWQLAFITLVLNRNMLIEDAPGMGKTSLVKFLARSIGLEFRRIQFTSDLLPSDVVGVSTYSRDKEQFIFRPGPIFTELVLADELNRANPKTQSALLQAMEEKQVTVDHSTYPLPENFCLFATQNPRGQIGTFPLPESQLDRFLFKTNMGRLSRGQELALLSEEPRSTKLTRLEQYISKEQLKIFQQEIFQIHSSESLLNYLADVLEATRKLEGVAGLSPRAGQDLLLGAKGFAWMQDRNFVLPDDIQLVFPFVAAHRLFGRMNYSTQQEQVEAREIIRPIKFIK